MISQTPYILGYVAAWILLLLISLTTVALLKKWRNKGKLRNFVFNSVAVVIGITSFVLIMEGYWGFFYDKTDFMGQLQTSKRWFKRYYRFNNMGFRDDKDYEYKKAAVKKRVVFIGDSFTAGHGIKQIEKRFSGLVEQYLKAAEEKTEVYTLAINGWDTINEIEFMEMAVKNGFEADVIILCFNTNDISGTSLGTYYDRYVMALLTKEQINKNWLLTHSFFLNFIDVRIRQTLSMSKAKEFYDRVITAYSDKEWREMQGLFQRFIQLCEDDQCKVKVVILPDLIDLKREFRLKIAHEKVYKFFTDNGIPVIDLAERLRGLPEDKLVVNRYDSHPGEFAHKVIADEIWGIFIKSLFASK